MERFIQFPDLPGVLISGLGGDRLLSRQQILECLLHTGQISPNESIQRLLHIANRDPLCLPISTTVLAAAKQALKQPLEKQSAPILVQQADSTYQLLDPRVLNIAHWQIRGIEIQYRYERLQMQLLQNEKMAALGRLVDGVAHEILDPVGFIWGNLSHISSYVQQQSKLLSAYETALPNPPEQIDRLAADIERDYLRSDLPAAIESAQNGAHRLKQLATSLQNFCHIDEVHPRPADLNTLIDSTLHLLKSRIATPVAIHRNYGKIPPVSCYAGQLSHVFITLLTHAIDAVLVSSQQTNHERSIRPSSNKAQPQITVTTRVIQKTNSLPPQTTKPKTQQADSTHWISIVIKDNGPGLSPSRQAQILNSFSTKSRSQKESGLALSYQIVTAKHSGQFLLRSNQVLDSQNEQVLETAGTEFELRLPLA